MLLLTPEYDFYHTHSWGYRINNGICNVIARMHLWKLAVHFTCLQRSPLIFDQGNGTLHSHDVYLRHYLLNPCDITFVITLHDANTLSTSITGSFLLQASDAYYSHLKTMKPSLIDALHMILHTPTYHKYIDLIAMINSIFNQDIILQPLFQLTIQVLFFAKLLILSCYLFAQATIKNTFQLMIECIWSTHLWLTRSKLPP